MDIKMKVSFVQLNRQRGENRHTATLPPRSVFKWLEYL